MRRARLSRAINKELRHGSADYRRGRAAPAPLPPADEGATREMSHKLVAKVQQTEDAILARHQDGTFNLTHLRYPNLYGPRQLAPREWSVVRRILDGRRTVPVIDGGLTLESRAYVENAAHAVLLVVDEPVISAGQTYHVADLVTPRD